MKTVLAAHRTRPSEWLTVVIRRLHQQRLNEFDGNIAQAEEMASFRRHCLALTVGSAREEHQLLVRLRVHVPTFRS